MVNVLLIPTSGLMEFNASAAAGGASATLDNAYANAVRMEIANSATLRFTGKNASDNRRIHVSGTNGDLMLVRDINVTSTASATMETPSVSSTKVSGVSAFFDTVSATNYVGNLGTGQFVDVSGDTMTGRLDLSAAASSTTVLSANGGVFVSGNVTVSSNISAVGEISSTGAHRGSSGVFTTTVQAPTLSGTSAIVSSLSALSAVSAASISSAGDVRAVSAIISNTVQAPTLSGTSATVSSLSALSSISANGSVLATGDMSSTGAHRGSSGIFTTTVQAPTLSGTSAIVSSLSALSAVSAASISSAGDIRAVSAIISNTVQAPTLSGTSATVSSISALSSVSAPSAFIQNISATNISAATNVSSAAFSGVSARFTDLSATSALAPTISATNISATTNVSSAAFSGLSAFVGNISATNISAVTNISSAAFSGVSARFTDLSATSALSPTISGTNISALTNLRGGNVSATTVTGLSGTFPTVSANTLQATSIIAGPVSGVAPTDANIQIASLGTGTLLLSSAQTNVSGPLSVNGHFAATSKAFLIDHPTPAKKAAGMKLQYACLEGPENGVYVRGKADTQVGVIELPDYWMDLVHADSITVQLTAMSPAQRLYVAKIEDNKVYVRDASAVSEVTTFFYTVNGERKDIDHLTIEY